MPFLSRLLGFLRRGWFTREGSEKNFIERISRGDIGYILEVGVPYPEAPQTPGPSVGEYGLEAEGIRYGSLMLVDPEALLYILVFTSQSVGRVTVRGNGLEALKRTAEAARRIGGVAYGYSLLDGGEIRLLAYKGLITGLYYEARGNKYLGTEALKALSSEYFDHIVFHLSGVKPGLVEWNDENLSVFVKGLDNQHKYLVNTLNSLYHATITGEAGKVIDAILSRLINYTKFHFKSEEILMEKYNYPVEKFEKHSREHRGFVEAAQRFKEKYDKGEADLTVEVFKFLASWVQNHIEKTDRDYGIYFLKIGIANYTPPWTRRLIN